MAEHRSVKCIPEVLGPRTKARLSHFAKPSSNFRPQSTLKPSGFEMEQGIGNIVIKRTLRAQMTRLNIDSEISPVPPVIFTEAKSAKFGL